MAEKKIVVSHINIRQSISVLLAKLITIDTIAAVLIGATYYLLNSGLLSLSLTFTVANILVYSALALLKISFTIYIILDWLSEYYEITPEYVFHRRGIFYQTEEKHKITQIDSITLEQGMLGKVLNFGNITTYNYRHDRVLSLYLIHNPTRYMKILEELTPMADEKKRLIRGSLVDLDKISNTF